MLIGAHVLLYTDNPEADRAFFRDVLEFPFVDAGNSWLIFKLPPAEAALHPTEGESRSLVHGERSLLGAVRYLMCDDLEAYLKRLETKKIRYSQVEKAPWGTKTTFRPPSAEVGLHQPTHPTALTL
ncbi:MAG TPA: VOC family protein [Candidatus Angelobacter sp.]|nr:VOC family protein [Candidatus Angelobacter sp.]